MGMVCPYSRRLDVCTVQRDLHIIYPQVQCGLKTLFWIFFLLMSVFPCTLSSTPSPSPFVKPNRTIRNPCPLSTIPEFSSAPPRRQYGIRCLARGSFHPSVERNMIDGVGVDEGIGWGVGGKNG